MAEQEPFDYKDINQFKLCEALEGFQRGVGVWPYKGYQLWDSKQENWSATMEQGELFLDGYYGECWPQDDPKKVAKKFCIDDAISSPDATKEAIQTAILAHPEKNGIITLRAKGGVPAYLNIVPDDVEPFILTTSWGTQPANPGDAICRNPENLNDVWATTEPIATYDLRPLGIDNHADPDREPGQPDGFRVRDEQGNEKFITREQYAKDCIAYCQAQRDLQAGLTEMANAPKKDKQQSL